MLENHDKRYKVYSFFNKGKRRVVQEPNIELKLIQKKLILELNNFPFHPACKAIKGNTLLSNAIQHEGYKYLLKVDIAHCYPSITKELVIEALATYGTEKHKQLVDIIKTFCFIYNGKQDILPTGAPSSSILCNIALTLLDYKIAETTSCNFTRYVDDLTFSTNERLLNLKQQIFQTIKHFGLTPNYKKSKWFSKESTDTFIVTGVNLKTHNKVPRTFTRQLRAKLANLAKAKLPIDQEARGCLAYIQSIDKNQYQYFLDYYQKRIQYGVFAPGISTNFK